MDDKTPILILKNIIQDGLLAVLMISHLMIFDDILKNIRNDSKIIKYHQIAINICTFSWLPGMEANVSDFVPRPISTLLRNEMKQNIGRFTNTHENLIAEHGE